MIYKTRLKNKIVVAEGTDAFHLEKPAGFDFKAGQYMDVTLLNPPETDPEGNTRAFSLAAAPQENELIIATRMRDTAFKRVIGAMPFESEIQIDGPMGSFTLHNDVSKPAVILAGGIGITPFRSIILDAAARALPHRIFLFYSNRRPEDAAFLEELKNIKNPNYTFIGTMTEMTASKMPWTGEAGYITGDMIKKYVPDISNAIFYIAGPPAMVAAMRDVLHTIAADDDNIKSEEFAGY